uniref:Uncharacterized protein n=1 Tax=Mycena chlorophos TaxID=658473 RepID=A0ABQ0LM66_MYCCL|nr:predicted protein [Mycena chlorophos]
MYAKVKQRAVREDNVGEYLALEAEEAAGERVWSASLAREKTLKEQIAGLRRSRADSAKLRIKALQKEVKAGSDARRVWRARKGVIREKMKSLRADELHGVRIPRPAPSDDVDQGAEDVEPTVLSNPDDPLAAFDDPTAFGLDPSFFAQPPSGSDDMDYWSVYGELPDELMGGLLEPPPTQDRLDFQIGAAKHFGASSCRSTTTARSWLINNSTCVDA